MTNEAQAAQALAEATIFAERAPIRIKPQVELTDDDGIVALHWRRSDIGILILFTGDGTATYSIKSGDSHYATSAKEMDLSRPIPADLAQRLAWGW